MKTLKVEIRKIKLLNVVCKVTSIVYVQNGTQKVNRSYLISLIDSISTILILQSGWLLY